MANMSYCRFQNTLRDLQDCFDNWVYVASDDEDTRELDAQKEMYKLCKKIVEDYET
jgi:hypothetical protein